MDIREITSQDSGAYYKLRVRSEEEYPEFVGFNAERELDAGADGIGEILSLYASEGTYVLGIFDNNILVGTLVASRRLSKKYRHKAFLWGMYVYPDFRGGGAAKLLMDEIIDWANNHPEIIALSLQVTLSNTRGQAFYKKYGFSIFGTEQNSLFASGEFHGVHYMELGTSNA